MQAGSMAIAALLLYQKKEQKLNKNNSQNTWI